MTTKLSIAFLSACLVSAAQAVPVQIADSGVQWELADGTLTISGTGAIPDFEWFSDIPWSTNATNIVSLSIGTGVTSIGQGAFRNCPFLQEVSLPSGLAYIGKGAFQDNDSLASVSIPESVEEIAEYAFDDCKTLSSVSFSGDAPRVKQIGEAAFMNCEALSVVSIPASVTNVGACAFSGCDSLATVCLLGTSTVVAPNAFLYVGWSQNVFITASSGDLLALGYNPFSDETWVPSKEKYGDFIGFKPKSSAELPDLLLPNNWTGTPYQNPQKSWCGGYFVLADESEGVSSISGQGTIADPWFLGGDIYAYIGDGTLFITGSGQMRDYESFAETAWADRNDEISAVVVDQGVVLGKYALSGLGTETAITYTRALGEVPSAVKAVSPAEVSAIAIVDDQVKMNLSVHSSTSLSVPRSNWEQADVAGAELKQDGTIDISLPADGNIGFFIIDTTSGE